MKRKLTDDIRVLFSYPIRLALICAVTAISGGILWFSLDSMQYIVRMACRAPFTIPFVPLVIHWLAVYIIFGILICRCSILNDSGEAALRAVTAYVFSIFWCPLIFSGGAFLPAILSLVFSAICICRMLIVMRAAPMTIEMSSFIILLSEAYYIYFTLVVSFVR